MANRFPKDELNELPKATIVISSPRGIVVEFPREAEKIFGWSSKEVIGKPVDVLFPPSSKQFSADLDGKDKASFFRSHSGLLETPRIITGLRKDGSVFPMEVALRPKTKTLSLSLDVEPTKKREMSDLVLDEKFSLRICDLTSIRNQSRYRDDFEEMEKLGAGAFGAVYKCKNKVDGKLYAVKKIKLYRSKSKRESTKTATRVLTPRTSPKNSSFEIEDKLTDESRKKGVLSLVESFTSTSSPLVPRSASAPIRWAQRKLAETSVLAQLESHPNVVRYYASWVEGGELLSPEHAIGAPEGRTLYIQMELCGSLSLKQWLLARDNERKIDPEQNLAIFYQILRGVHHIHQSGYMHRDIKPANILLSPFLPPFPRSPPPPSIDTLRRQSAPSRLSSFFGRNNPTAPQTISPTSGSTPKLPSPHGSASQLNHSSSLIPKPVVMARPRGVSLPLQPAIPTFRRCRSELTERVHFLDVPPEDSPPSSSSTLSSFKDDSLEPPREVRITNRLATIANYMVKIGDFGLATRISNEIIPPLHAAPLAQSKSSDIGSSTPFLPLPYGTKERKKHALKASNSLDKFTSICHRVCPNHRKSGTPVPCQRSGMKTCGIGTALYASPEQLHSHEYGEETDIFSLGLLLVELYSISESKKHRYKKLERARAGDLPQSMLSDYPQEAMLAMQLLNENPQQRPKAGQVLAHSLFQSFQRNRERNQTNRHIHPSQTVGLRGSSTPVMRSSFRTLQGSPRQYGPSVSESTFLDSIHERDGSSKSLVATPVQRRHMRTLELLRDSDTPRHVYSSSRDSDTPTLFMLPSSLSDAETTASTPAGQSPSTSSRSSPTLTTGSSTSASISGSPSLICHCPNSICHCLDREKLELNFHAQKQVIEQLSSQLKKQEEAIRQKDATISQLTKALQREKSKGLK